MKGYSVSANLLMIQLLFQPWSHQPHHARTGMLHQQQHMHSLALFQSVVRAAAASEERAVPTPA